MLIRGPLRSAGDSVLDLLIQDAADGVVINLGRYTRPSGRGEGVRACRRLLNPLPENNTFTFYSLTYYSQGHTSPHRCYKLYLYLRGVLETKKLLYHGTKICCNYIEADKHVHILVEKSSSSTGSLNSIAILKTYICICTYVFMQMNRQF